MATSACGYTYQHLLVFAYRDAFACEEQTLMVLLTVTASAKAAIAEHSRLQAEPNNEVEADSQVEPLHNAAVGSPIDHSVLIKLSTVLLNECRRNPEAAGRAWTLDTLLKGADVYQPPPPPKSEPTAEYKALMKRLRAEEEQKQYDRMLNPPPVNETFNQRFPNSGYAFNPATSIGQAPGADEVDELTYADVNRQLGLIINVLISIVCCGVAIWVAARRWSVPQRLGLSMSGSIVVAVAEVVIYTGYIRRVGDAKSTERKNIETKEIVETWILSGSGSEKSSADDNVRHRKGKHR